MTGVSNVPFDAIEVGRTLSVSRTVTRMDIEALTFLSGDIDSADVELAGARGLPSDLRGARDQVSPYCMLGPIRCFLIGIDGLHAHGCGLLNQQLRKPSPS